MGAVIYKPIIEEMVWSYSRINSYIDCPYRFFLKYIKEYEEEDRFFASYGSFIHNLIEQYYRRSITKDEMLINFLTDFNKMVRGERPSPETVEKYILCGAEYIKQFKTFPFEMVDVEKKIEFEVAGYSFICYIDYIGKRDGEYHIVDNKSKDLKRRSKKIKPTKTDIELDNYLKQLYLYSAAIKKEYGIFPKTLCFNCFKTGEFIEEPFVEKTYFETIEWAKSSIEEIKNDSDFLPNKSFFSCRYICGVNDHCCYYDL